MCEVRALRIALIGSPTSSDESAENLPVRGSFVPDAITTATHPSMTRSERTIYLSYLQYTPFYGFRKRTYVIL